VNARDVFQEAGITDARQLRFVVIGGKSGGIVLRLVIEALQVELGLIGQWSAGEKLLQQLRRWTSGAFTLASTAQVGIDHEFVDAEGFFVEENPGVQAR